MALAHPAPGALHEALGGPRLSTPALLRLAMLGLVIANLGRIPVLDLGKRQAPLLVYDIGVLAALAAAALTAFRTRSFRLDDVAFTGLLFAGIGAASAFAAIPRFGLSGIEVVASLAYLARWLVYFCVYLAVINFVRHHAVESLWGAVEVALLVIAAFGIVQSVFLPDFAQTVYPAEADQWDRQGHRLMSTILEPNIAAAMIVVVLLVQLARLSAGAPMALWRPALLFVALVLTLSRSGMLAFLVGGTLILLVRGLSRRLLRFAAAMGVGLLLALPKLIAFGMEYTRFRIDDASAASRVVSWLRALELFLLHPWIGIGFNTYGFVQERRGFERGFGSTYSVEGGLLFIAVMTGIVGLAVFSVMLWRVVRRCRAGWRHRAATPAERGLCIGAAAATVAVCVHSVFVNSLLVPFVMGPLFILWGLVSVSVSRMGRASPAEP